MSTPQSLDAGSFVGSLEELRTLAGQEVFVTDWVLLSQRHIDLFAEASGDFQWIHVDVARAHKESPYGNTIAHGFLTLSLLGQFYAKHVSLPFCEMGLNYGLNKVRFMAPVRVNSRLRALLHLQAAEKIAGDAWQLTWQVSVACEGQDKPVCVAQYLVRRYPPPAN
jgi:acyl dehydratase